MPTSDIETELLKTTDLKPKKKEDRQAFLHRLVDAVQDLDDDDWKGLSTEAQSWVNAGASAIKDEGDEAEINDFPDFITTDEEESENEAQEAAEHAESDDDEEESDVADDEDKPTTKKKSSKPAKAEKAPAKAAKPEKKAATGPKAGGIKVQIKKLVLKKPSISVEELIEKLGNAGTKPSKLTVSAIRSEFRHSLFVLRDAGALSGDIDLG